MPEKDLLPPDGKSSMNDISPAPSCCSDAGSCQESAACQGCPEDSAEPEQSLNSRRKQDRKKLFSPFGRAICDFSLLSPGDRIVLGISGGKDSMTMLVLLDRLSKRMNYSIDLIPVTVIDSSQSPDIMEGLSAFILEATGLKLNIVKAGIKDYLETNSTSPGENCFYCSRIRRSALFREADGMGANKIALGHHADDLIETLMMNIFYGGRLESMAVKFKASKRGRFEIIRPLAYIWENHIKNFVKTSGIPTIGCICPVHNCKFGNLKRKFVKSELSRLAGMIPDVKSSMLSSLSRVNTGWLMDRRFLDLGKIEALESEIERESEAS